MYMYIYEWAREKLNLVLKKLTIREKYLKHIRRSEHEEKT
jgi:hypothetical protein